MESLILSILGDIIGFKYKKRGERFTIKKYGRSMFEKSRNMVTNNFFDFISNGGVTQYLGKEPYSFPTLILFATMKGIGKDKNNSVKSCKNEYMKLYETYKEQKLNKYYINKTHLSSLANLKNIQYIADNDLLDKTYNDSMVIIRAIPFGLMYYKKEDRKKLIKEIISNIRLTHNNYTCILGAIGLGLFLSYSKSGISIQKWAYQLTDYLLSKEFDDIIKELDLYDTEFIIVKEDYISLWKEYLLNVFKSKENIHDIRIISSPSYRNLYLYSMFTNENEFVYGIGADDSLIIAYNSLLYSNENWQNMIIQGVLGITDNSVMGMICGALYGCQYKFENVWINKYVNEDWVKKSIKLGKSLGI